MGFSSRTVRESDSVEIFQESLLQSTVRVLSKVGLRTNLRAASRCPSVLLPSVRSCFNEEFLRIAEKQETNEARPGLTRRGRSAPFPTDAIGWLLKPSGPILHTQGSPRPDVRVANAGHPALARRRFAQAPGPQSGCR